MLRYMIRRLLWAVVLFLAVTIVSYVLFFIIPADPAKQACGQACTQDDDASASKHFLHLDRPIYEQYGYFLWNLVAPPRISAAPTSTARASTRWSPTPRP